MFLCYRCYHKLLLRANRTTKISILLNNWHANYFNELQSGVSGHSEVSSKPSFAIKSSKILWSSSQLLCLALILCNHEVFWVTTRRHLQQTFSIKEGTCVWCKISLTLQNCQRHCFQLSSACSVSGHSFGLVWSAQWGLAQLTVRMKPYSDTCMRTHIQTHKTKA